MALKEIINGILNSRIANASSAIALTFGLFGQTYAETAVSAVIADGSWPPGYVERYESNPAPGVTDMTAGFATAFLVAAQTEGGQVVGILGPYRLTAPVGFGATAVRNKFWSTGSLIICDHNGNGINILATNENYSHHTVEGWHIRGPNTLLPPGGYVPVSTGAGLNMNRDATTNVSPAYQCEFRDLQIEGFKYGADMQCAQACKFDNVWFLFNQYGERWDGGQTNANHHSGCHYRENRVCGLYSTGRTGGSLSNATANTFVGCQFESNIPYPFVSGGAPPTDSTAIYLNGTYDCVFEETYSENHAASIYLTGGSSGNQFIKHRFSGGTGRIDQIILDGAGVNGNTFDAKNNSNNATDVSVVSNNANQTDNKFTGEGFNFISASILSVLDYDDIKPSVVYGGARGVGLIRMPHRGWKQNVDEGTGPGQINGIGTATATLNVQGIGELVFGNGITGNTIITSITGLKEHQLLMLVNSQAGFTVTIDSNALNGNVGLLDANDVVFNAVGQSIFLYRLGNGTLVHYGSNFTLPLTALKLIDGVAAPSTIAGVAQIYVDVADGDLKVKFGDGFVRTIGLDS